MARNNKLVEAFRALHREKFGEVIPYEVAERQLQELANIVRLTAPVEKEETNAQVTHS